MDRIGHGQRAFLGRIIDQQGVVGRPQRIGLPYLGQMLFKDDAIIVGMFIVVDVDVGYALVRFYFLLPRPRRPDLGALGLAPDEEQSAPNALSVVVVCLFANFVFVLFWFWSIRREQHIEEFFGRLGLGRRPYGQAEILIEVVEEFQQVRPRYDGRIGHVPHGRTELGVGGQLLSISLPIAVAQDSVEVEDEEWLDLDGARGFSRNQWVSRGDCQGQQGFWFRCYFHR